MTWKRIVEKAKRPLYLPSWVAIVFLVLVIGTVATSYQARQEALGTAERTERQVQCQAEFNRLFYKISKNRSQLAQAERRVQSREKDAFVKLINDIGRAFRTDESGIIEPAFAEYQKELRATEKRRAQLQERRQDYVYPPLSQEGSCVG